MLSELYYFNSTAITAKDVPLPLSPTESVIFYVENVFFAFKSKQTRERVESAKGRFFLTTLRVVYIPESKLVFSSFFVPLNKLFAVENNNTIECLCENSYIGVISINFKSWQNEYYYSEIKKTVEGTVMDVDELMMEGSVESLPYYSDLCDE